MRKVQKIMAIVSVIVILALAVVLGIILWKGSDYGRITETNQQGEEDSQGESTLTDGEESDAAEEKETETSGEQEEDTLEKEPVITDVSMIFTGDVLFGNSVKNKYDGNGIRGILSEFLQQEMVQADLTMVNEEFPFSNRGTRMPDKQYTFRVDPSYVGVFHEMGIDVVSLANNHALDYGKEALLDTFTTLDEAGIPYVGAGETRERAEQTIYIECSGRTVGILSASRVIPVSGWNIEYQQPGLFCTYDSTAIVAAIKEARSQCDYLMVYVHWGIEHQEYPKEYQRVLGQQYIDAGADLVVGSHPHAPQGIEYYQGKPIVYSLGNFIFNPSNKNTYVLKVLWSGAGESQLQVIPVKSADCYTSQMEGQEALEMLQYIEKISYDVTIDENGMVSRQ